MSVEFEKSVAKPGAIRISRLVSFRAANTSFTGLAKAVGTTVDDINSGGKVAGANMALHMAKGSRLRCRRRYMVHWSLVDDSMMVLGPRATFANAAKRCD